MLTAMKKALILVAALVVSVGLYGWSLAAFSGDSGGARAQTAAETPIRTVDLNQSTEPPPVSETADVIESVLPSVVNVRIKSVTFDPLGGQQTAQGEGSGVVIDADGIIVTNFHVVRTAVSVNVVLSDGRTVEGRVIGAAPERDLAVIKVNADNLKPIRIGKSSSLRLGDDVIAIGFPLGLSGGATVTKGIVSSTSRTIDPQGGVRLTGVLQTDAAINPGNSGGALVDGNGHLVGINTAAAGAAAAENVGFAIGIDSALPTINEILNKPAEQRAWLGVDIHVPLTPGVATQLNLPVTQGALVSGTFEGSPAREAGIQAGDVIVAIDGDQVTDNNALSEILANRNPGDEIDIRLVGPDGERTVTVTLDQRPPEFLPQG
jgi:S1-C subfamily serine protease